MAKTDSTVRLMDSDWDMIFKSTPFTLGSTTLEIKPLGLKDLNFVAKEWGVIQQELEKEGVSFESLRNDLPSLAKVLATKSPALISIMSGLSIEDVGRLPLIVALNLTTVCLEVNLSSSEDFLKNLTALMINVQKLIGSIPG